MESIDIIAMIAEMARSFFHVFVNGTFFLMIKIFLVIYSTVLIVDVILLMYLGNVRKQLRSMRTGTSAKKTTKSADIREWQAIMNRLQSNNEQQYLAAILEADRFVYKALEVHGYSGSNFAERLAQIPAGSFSSLPAIQDVHALSNLIIQKGAVSITEEQAKNALGVYEKFLKNIDFL